MSSFSDSSSFNPIVSVKFLAIAFVLVFLSACADLKLVRSDGKATEPRSVDAEKQEPVKKPLETEAAVSINYPDPMAGKVIPLALVKGYSQVNQLVEQKAFNSALQLLQRLQLAHPEHSGPSYKLARLYFQQSAFDKALSAIKKSLAIDNENYHVHNLHAILLRSTGKFQQAKAAYLQALKIYPGYSKGHLNLAILADIYLYDLKLALNHYQQYQLLKGSEEGKVSGWIIDLKRRIAKEG